VLITITLVFLKLLPLSSKESEEKKLCQRGKETSLDLLFTCLLLRKFRFDAMLCSNLGNENSDADHIKCSRGPHLTNWPQVPHPCFAAFAELGYHPISLL